MNLNKSILCFLTCGLIVVAAASCAPKASNSGKGESGTSVSQENGAAAGGAYGEATASADGTAFDDGTGATAAGRIEIPELKKEYPRMIDGNAAIEYIQELLTAEEEAANPEALTDEQKAIRALKNKIEPYVARHVTDPQWIVSRLQLFWKDHYTDIYVNGEDYDHAEGHAPVPTVRYSASRGGQTNYRRPPLEDVRPYQDSLGLWVIYKPTGQMEWADPRKTGSIVESINKEIMTLALDAAFLYWTGGDTRYAKFAADIFDTYMAGLYYRNVPIDLNHGQQQTLVGLTSWEVIHEEIAVKAAECYDYLHDYLARERSGRISMYEDTFRKWAQNIIDNGVPHNNWNLIQARFALTIAIVLGDDDAYSDGRGRQYFLNQILNESSIRQWSVGRLIDFGFDDKTGAWYESPSYSAMVVWEFMTFVNLAKNSIGIDLTENYPILLRAVDALPQYLLPNGMRVSWGDGFYEMPDTTEISWPKGPIEDYVSPTFYTDKVSWFAARTGMDPQNSLMMSVAGSKGNHMHANGISLELYGRGYIQGVDLGRGTGYTTLDYTEFYSQFPAHNTVCVDGVSSYPTMMSQHGYNLESCYPAPTVYQGRTDQDDAGQDGAPGKWDSFGGVMYGDFSFIEPETQSDQRRQVLIIATDPDCGYYVDVFRSRRRDGQDKYHDYFYHNIGQDFTLDCPLEPTEELAFAGGHIYAYSYLWDKYASQTDADVSGKFTMTLEDGSENGMRLWMRGEQDRTVFKVLSPCIYSLTRTPMPYDMMNSPAQTFIARQYGEAWTRPFAAVYEPYGTAWEEEAPSAEGATSQIGFNATGDESDALDGAGEDGLSEKGAIARVEWPECGVTSGVALKVTRRDGRQDFIFSADSSQEFSVDLSADGSGAGSKDDKSAGSALGSVSGNAVIAVVSDGEYFMARGTALSAGGVKITSKEPATVAVFRREDRWYYSADAPCRVRMDGKTRRLSPAGCAPLD